MIHTKIRTAPARLRCCALLCSESAAVWWLAKRRPSGSASAPQKRRQTLSILSSSTTTPSCLGLLALCRSRKRANMLGRTPCAASRDHRASASWRPLFSTTRELLATYLTSTACRRQMRRSSTASSALVRLVASFTAIQPSFLGALCSLHAGICFAMHVDHTSYTVYTMSYEGAGGSRAEIVSITEAGPVQVRTMAERLRACPCMKGLPFAGRRYHEGGRRRQRAPWADDALLVRRAHVCGRRPRRCGQGPDPRGEPQDGRRRPDADAQGVRTGSTGALACPHLQALVPRSP